MKSVKAQEADIMVYSVDMPTETSEFVSRFVKLAQKVSNKENEENEEIVIMD